MHTTVHLKLLINDMLHEIKGPAMRQELPTVPAEAPGA
jgi:hypothetical protein